MINIAINRAEGIITGFEIEGHSSYAKHGKDIVCAGISALSQAAILGLLSVAKADVDFNMHEGYILCEIKQGDDKADAILDTMYLGIVEIQRNYKDHINIKEVGTCE